MINVPELFSSYVFNDGEMKKRLSEEDYSSFKKTVSAGLPLDKELASSVAEAMKNWAIEHGATHYTHWFQPMTGITAEKHDSFISPISNCEVIMKFSGKELIKGEGDAKYVELSSADFSEYALEPVESVAKIGDVCYATLAEAIAAAQAGDTVELLSDLADAVVEVTKNLTITGSVTLNNVGINANGADELTVSGLTFTGNSWINSGTAEKLTVSGVTANVNPSNAAYTNSRSAFISLGRSEQQTLALLVENCNIVANGGADPILGWACITEATLTGNTFGSANAYQNNSDSVKFMSIADGAVFKFINNIIS